MVLTYAKFVAFFEDDDQMEIPETMRIQIQQKGIDNPSNIDNFDKDKFTQGATNLRHPGGRIPVPDPNTSTVGTILEPPFIYGSKFQMRLLATCNLLHYYETVWREINTSNTHSYPITKNFTEQWKALSNSISDGVDLPKILKMLSITKWMEAFKDFLNRRIGVWKIPLINVTIQEVTVSETAPHPATNRPHSIEHRSVEEELTVSSSQDHRDKAGENGIPDEYNMGFGEEDSGMELDSRANMAVVG